MQCVERDVWKRGKKLLEGDKATTNSICEKSEVHKSFSRGNTVGMKIQSAD